MSVTYSDELSARLCPACSAIPCRCSRLTRLLEATIRGLERLKQARDDARQQQIRRWP